MMFMSFNSDTRGVTSGASTAYTSRTTEFSPAISGVRVQCYVFVVFPLYSVSPSSIFGFGFFKPFV